MSLSDQEVQIRTNFVKRVKSMKDKRYAGDSSKIPYSKTKLPLVFPTENAVVTIQIRENTLAELKALSDDVGCSRNLLTYDQLIKRLIFLVKQKGTRVDPNG